MPATFHPARRGSLRVAPWQAQRLPHAARLAIMEAARRLERRSHGKGMHGGALRRTGLAVLWALLFRGRSAAGCHDPALSQLAEWAGCARSTVQQAIARLEAAGILRHLQRGLVVVSRGRARWAQWTSVYLFRPAARWLLPSDTGSRQAIDSTVKKQPGLNPAAGHEKGRPGFPLPPCVRPPDLT